MRGGIPIHGPRVNAVLRNAMKVMPLHGAAASRRDEVSRMFVEAGADLNAAQRDGFMPVHEAAQNGDVELVDVLLDRGARIDVGLDDGRTPADLADEAGHKMLAKRLRIGAGATGPAGR